MAAENNLGKDKVSRLVWRIAIPSMLGQFVSVLYSIVDRMYIGNIPEIGDVALAGVGVCGPVVTMVGSVAVLVGVGGAPLVSIRMGEEDLSAAKKVLANCFLMLIVFSVLLVGGILPFREPMLRLFGASDATYPFAEEYFTAYLCGTFFALAASGLNQFIICQGFAKIGHGLGDAGRGAEHCAGPGVHLRPGHGRAGGGHRHGDFPGGQRGLCHPLPLWQAGAGCPSPLGATMCG